MSEIQPPGAEHFEDVAVVMITRNEEGAIAKVIDDACQALPGAEIMVVDGSSDLTPLIAAEHGARVIREPGGGPAPALLCALRASDRPIIITIDADDTYPAAVFPELANRIRAGDDVAGTDRLGRRPPEAMPLSNWCANVTFGLLASVRTRKRLRDVHSGQRAYRRQVIHQFDWDTDGLAFPVDLLLWPARAGCQISETPISYRDRIGTTSLSRWADGVQTLRRLFRPLRGKTRQYQLAVRARGTSRAPSAATLGRREP
jgi:glycosyltransferase involved in cell wall biosynthesis